MTSAPPAAAVVIGVGNTFRHDDAIGAAAVERLRSELPEADVIALDGEPTRLIEAWAGRELAVVVDAVRVGELPGSIHRVEVGVDPLPDWAPSGSTHSAGLAEAVALGRALDRLPRHLVVYGIEPADLTEGEGLSPPAEHALPELVRHVVAEVRTRCA